MRDLEGKLLTKRLCVEVKDLKIDRRSVKWNVLARVEPYGSALKIDLEEGIPRGQCIEVDVR